jgi:serine/threonine-protein kinase
MGTLHIGDTLERYTIQAIIGEGAFGTVYRAWDPLRKRAVAIKELSARNQALDPGGFAERRERFRRERRIQTRLVHPHIVAIYEPLKMGETEYVVEEFLDGGTLADLMGQQGPIAPERVIQIGIDICRAIGAAWERDIVHRDINPGNIFLTGDGQAKLAGFGMAQVGRAPFSSPTGSRAPGTPTYQSPEQEEGYPYLDERSDLYSLGLVLYEALTGTPFAHRHVPVRQVTRKVPIAVEKAVMRALAHDVDARYQDAASFETALRQALERPRSARLWGIAAIGIVVGLIAAGTLVARSMTASQSRTPEPTAAQTDTALETPPPSLTPLPTPTQAAIEATATPIPSPLPTETTSRATATAVPTSRPTPLPTATEAPVSTATPPPSPRPTRLPAISAPLLSVPPGASDVKTPDMTVSWTGTLPNSAYGFVVSMYQMDGVLAHTSPVLSDEQWTVHLPGVAPAGQAVGEWRWSVAVVRRAAPRVVLVQSDEWTFYFSPFAGP